MAKIANGWDCKWLQCLMLLWYKCNIAVSEHLRYIFLIINKCPIAHLLLTPLYLCSVLQQISLAKAKKKVLGLPNEIWILSLRQPKTFFFFIIFFLELEITLVKFFIVLLDCAKYHNLHIFFQMLHDFERIYCIFLGQLGKSTWTTYQRHLTREIRHFICEIHHLTHGIWLKISKKNMFASDQMVKISLPSPLGKPRTFFFSLNNFWNPLNLLYTHNIPPKIM